jgi:hypothetical protein
MRMCGADIKKQGTGNRKQGLEIREQMTGLRAIEVLPQ